MDKFIMEICAYFPSSGGQAPSSPRWNYRLNRVASAFTKYCIIKYINSAPDYENSKLLWSSQQLRVALCRIGVVPLP